MQGPDPATTRTRLESIDCLRGVAALAVVLQHALTFGNHQAVEALWFRGIAAVLDHGHLGVPLFFVISGFCIHLRWAQRHKATGARDIDFVSFWKRRIYRLYPAYFVVLCLSMTLVLCAYLAGLRPPMVELYPDPKPQWMAADFVVHAAMLHGLHPLFDKAGGNPPFWSLAREEYLYLMYFALLAIRTRRGIAFASAVSFAAGFLFLLAMQRVLPGGSPWWPVVQTSALSLWIQWTLGAVAVEAMQGLIRLPAWCSSLPLGLLWAVLAKWLGAYFPSLEPLGWGLAFFTLVNGCVRAEVMGRWPKASMTRWLSSVGVFSYSLYLVHYPVRAVVKQVIGPVAATTNPWAYLGCIVLMTVAGYLAAKVFFAAVESRFITAPIPRGEADDVLATSGLAAARGTK